MEMETKKAHPGFTDRFKIEAVEQVTERGHPVAEVSVWPFYLKDGTVWKIPGDSQG